MLGRRLLIFVAVLMGLAALVAAVAPRPATVSPTPSDPDAAARPELEARDGDAPAAASAGDAPVLRLEAGDPGQAVEAAVGERVRLEVTVPSPATVQVGERGLIQAANPSAPARFSLRYEEPGQVPVRVLGPTPGDARVIGVVRVR